MDVRTRIAPSPTGPVHVGTAYTALFNRTFAHKHGGQFILRIEDTDQERSKPVYETMIIDALKWLGLTWDEGTDVGGPYASYRQSERTEIYREYAQILLDKGILYKCWCTPKRLELLRKRQQANKEHIGYDKHCLHLSDEEKKELEARGEPYVLRLNMPAEGEVRWMDFLRGERKVNCTELTDIILMKSDGFPTYHLANVVDDHLMKISHVIRGLEWQDTTPYHWYMYDAFEWEKPKFIHMAWMMGEGGKKLSKRRNPVSVDFYRSAGFMPEALLNFFGLLNYSYPEDKEIFTLDEFQNSFEIERMSKGEGAYFDLVKLKNINSIYLRDLAEKKPDEFKSRLMHYFEDWVDRIGAMATERMELFSDFTTQNWFYNAWDIPTWKDPWDVKHIRKVGLEPLKDALLDYQKALSALDGNEWTVEKLEETAEQVLQAKGWESKKERTAFFMAVRIAVSGKTMTPPIFDTLATVERFHVISRLNSAVEYLVFRLRP